MRRVGFARALLAPSSRVAPVLVAGQLVRARPSSTREGLERYLAAGKDLCTAVLALSGTGPGCVRFGVGECHRGMVQPSDWRSTPMLNGRRDRFLTRSSEIAVMRAYSSLWFDAITGE